MLEFDVFGRRLSVERVRGRWAVYEASVDGKRRPATGVRVPPWVEEDELDRFLSDHFHESATPEHPEVVRVESRAP